MELTENSTFNYASYLRGLFVLIEDRYKNRQRKNPDTTESEVFKIDPSFTAETFLCGLYLLEDTSNAIDNYSEFGLDGPTKYENIGESYLRLYGLLNSTYMQFVCCREFHKMFKSKSLIKYKKESKNLKILKVRHSAASHSINYSEDGIRDFYKISQMTVKGYGERIHVIGEKDDEYEFNIKEDLNKFNKFIGSELSLISHFLLNKHLDRKSNHFKEFKEDLELIDEKAKGSIIIKGGDDKYYHVDTEPPNIEDILKDLD